MTTNSIVAISTNKMNIQQRKIIRRQKYPDAIEMKIFCIITVWVNTYPKKNYKELFFQDNHFDFSMCFLLHSYQNKYIK